MRKLFLSTASPWILARWSLAAFPLVAIAVAMELHAEGVLWTVEDFVVAGVLLGGAAGLYEVALHASANIAYRLGAFLTISGCLFMTWANLAVGIVGNENNDWNLMFLALPLEALLGAGLSRFKARGLRRTLQVMLTTQLLMGGLAWSAGYSIPLFTLAFVAWWAGAAWCFMLSQREEDEAWRYHVPQ